MCKSNLRTIFLVTEGWSQMLSFRMMSTTHLRNSGVREADKENDTSFQAFCIQLLSTFGEIVWIFWTDLGSSGIRNTMCWMENLNKNSNLDFSPVLHFQAWTYHMPCWSLSFSSMMGIMMPGLPKQVLVRFLKYLSLGSGTPALLLFTSYILPQGEGATKTIDLSLGFSLGEGNAIEAET